ncbi:MAG: hypothetical protein MPW14_19910 [Candidatus Manganitrophus sp.]|nr:MAG: hypothetical protein MPW14_19910 [Candidatus Manganitrophus sp.]
MMKTGVFLLSLFGVLALMITAGANATGPDHPAVSYTLTSEMKGEKRLFVGAGGKIKGMVNPDLFVNEWDVVEITLINGDNLNHHIAIPNFHILSETVSEKGKRRRSHSFHSKAAGLITTAFWTITVRWEWRGKLWW